MNIEKYSLKRWPRYVIGGGLAAGVLTAVIWFLGSGVDEKTPADVANDSVELREIAPAKNPFPTGLRNPDSELPPLVPSQNDAPFLKTNPQNVVTVGMGQPEIELRPPVWLTGKVIPIETVKPKATPTKRETTPTEPTIRIQPSLPPATTKGNWGGPTIIPGNPAN